MYYVGGGGDFLIDFFFFFFFVCASVRALNILLYIIMTLFYN